MFTGKQLNNYAKVLMCALREARRYKYHKGDVVRLVYNPAATPLAEYVHREILTAGFIPNVAIMSDNRLPGLMTPKMEQDYFTLASNKQLDYLGAWQVARSNSLHGSIILFATEDLEALKDVDPKKIARYSKSAKPIKDAVSRRTELGLLGWTLCLYPTESLANNAGMTLTQYKNQIVKACHLNAEDPVAEWKKIFKEINRICKKLTVLDIETIIIESNNFTLSVNIGKKRKWVGGGGYNIPSFEIFTSPDWRGTKGHYYANLPSFRDGQKVEGVCLVFKDSVVSNIFAANAKGEEYTRAQMSMDEGANRIGELSFTDKRFSRIDKFMAETLFDENFGGKYGNCHIAIGSSYPETYTGSLKSLTTNKKNQLGFNDSSLHWDLVNTEKKEVTAILKNKTRKIIYKDGLFII